MKRRLKRRQRRNGKFDAYYRAIEADKAWQKELVRLFKSRAGDVRYTAKGRGAPGTKLRALHDEFKKTSAAWGGGRHLLSNPQPMLYGVFTGSKFGITRNKKQAIAHVNKHGGEVRAIRYHRGESTSYDAPTFRVLSDRIYGKTLNNPRRRSRRSKR